MTGGGSLLPQIIILLLLIGCNAFFAAAEMAIISLNNQKVKRQAEAGDPRARLLVSLTGEPSRFLATIQVGVTLAGLLASAVASESFADQLAGWLVSLKLPLKENVTKSAALILITLVLAYFTLVLGELVPKRVAMEKAEWIARWAVLPLNFLGKVTGPFVRLLSLSTNLVIRMLGGNPTLHEERISEEEIRLMVDVGRERGVIQSTEQEMIDNIFKFDNTTAAAVMTPRLDVVALPWDADGSRVIETMIREKYSRIPVYQETIDNIVGILHVQDLIPVLKEYRQDQLDLKALLKPPYFVPFAKKTDVLLRELQRTKNHMAVVIDEYGGTAGIVTIEDLLEEIVGNIFDERDEETKEVEQLDERTFLVTGTISLASVAELTDQELPVADFDTLGGFVMAGLGRIPGREEQPEFRYHNLLFQVAALDDKRIAKVKITKL